VEYDDDSEKPTFDLIIGVESMKEFGIILNFQEQVIIIDDDTLPMRDITNLPLPRKKGLDFKNLARSLEPNSTEMATQRAV
jgi:hypothetical protein